MFVLVAESDEGGQPRANSSYQYIDGPPVLSIPHDRGDEFTASDLPVRSSDGRARWHELAGSVPSRTVGAGDTVQVSSNNAYGSNVNRGVRISVVCAPPTGNETVVDTWEDG